MTVNNIPLPLQAKEDSSLTFEWLGTLWTSLYVDTRLIGNYCDGTSLAAAQTYLEFLELVNTFSRQDIPLFHREIWAPIVIRKSQRGEGNKLVVGLEPTVVVGPQPADTVYQPRTVYPIGGAVARSGFVIYPFSTVSNVAGGMNQLLDRIISPQTVLLKGTHYTLQGDEIVFREDYDPFESGDFSVNEIYDSVTDTYDEEILLWGTDTLVDWDYVYNFYGYQIDFRFGSSDYYFNAVNALWDLRFNAANLSAVRRAIGNLLGVPTTSAEPETVEAVVSNADGTTTVITDAAVYTAGANELLRSEVIEGAELDPGYFLTDTVHYYTKLDPDRFTSANRLPLSQFLVDVPVLKLPPGIAGNNTIRGIDVQWLDTDIIYNGDDANGNPKLSFEVGGSENDLDTFWQSIWDRFEDENESMADWFSGYLWSAPPYLQDGIPVGSINPMQFFMRNFLKYNVGVIVVDFSALPDYIRSLDVFARLGRSLPAHAPVISIITQPVEDTVGFVASESLLAQYGKKVEDSVPDVTEAGLRYRWVRI